MLTRAAFTLCAATALAVTAEARAQAAVRPAIAAVRRAGPITVDGILTDAAWRTSRPVSGFVQQKPVEGQPAEYQTEVAVVYDDEALYVAAHMYDPAPASIARQLFRRDGDGNADWFAVGFDPRLDRRTAYVFWLTAAGVQKDAYLFNDKDSDDAWDAVWESAVRVDSTGWTAELRIPLSQLRYETAPGERTWGINFARFRVASNEESHFALMSQLQQGLVSQFGLMTGLRTEHAPRRLELRPYAVGGGDFSRQVPGNPFFDGRTATRRAGLDMRYGLGSSFTLDATVNPDFGQVEADPAVINLTAFETFFPERRPFFVEDARIFDFALSGGNNRLFYGRRIGRAPTGRAPDGADHVDMPEAATILGAAKLTGRTSSGLSIGAITAVTREEQGRAAYAGTGEIRRFVAEPATVHSAVRARQDLAGGASTIGAIATLQARRLPGDRSFAFLPTTAMSGGVDWEHQWQNRTYAFFGYVAASRVAGDSLAMIRIQRSSTHYFQRPDARRLGVDSAAGSLAGIDWRMTLEKRRGTHWTGSVWAAQVTPGFEVNDLGFSGRQEVLDGGARVQYRDITPGTVFRSYRITASTFHNWTHDVLEDAWSARSWGDGHVSGSVSLSTNATLLNYWDLESTITWRPELADRNGTRGGPMMLTPRSWQWTGKVSTDSRRAVAFEPALTIERRADGAGWRQLAGLDVTWRPSPMLLLSVEPQFERNRIGAQYVTTSTSLPYTPTFGARYLFADLDRTELSVPTRLNVTMSPRLTLQLFAQPLLSAGNYLKYKQLAAARTFSFVAFTEGDYAAAGGGTCAGGRTCQDATGRRLVDFDGNGTSDLSFTDRDFNIRSLIGNAVLRWEYRPGSTLYLVWQRQQEDAGTEPFSLGRDARGLLAAEARNVFLLKVSYWLGL